MPRRIVIIQGHPDRGERQFCHALADAYATGAGVGGHQVTRIDIAALEAPLLDSQKAFEHGALPARLRPAAEAILAADHLVFVFPLWLGTLPAAAHGFLEQLLRPGFAFANRDRGFPRPLLKGRSARLVVTMGMPALAYRWWYGAHGVRGLERSVLGFVGIGPIRRTLIGDVDAIGEAQRAVWLRRLGEMGERGW